MSITRCTSCAALAHDSEGWTKAGDEGKRKVVEGPKLILITVQVWCVGLVLNQQLVSSLILSETQLKGQIEAVISNWFVDM